MPKPPTRYEILTSEPGYKLDNWVAEFVMGLEFRPMSDGWYSRKDNIFIPAEDWKPSTDINCAREVLKCVGFKKYPEDLNPFGICTLLLLRSLYA